MAELLPLIASLVLILVCGLFVAAEFSFLTVDKGRVERLAGKGDKQAQGVLASLKSLSTQLSSAQIGITITNLAIGILAEPAIASLLEEPLLSAGIPSSALYAVAVTIGITLATFATMVFGELIPKNLAITKPMATAKFVQSFHRGFTWLMRYPILFLNASANKILRAFGVEPQEELASARSADELLSVVRRSAKKGSLTQETAFMLERSLEFSEKNGADVATPRVRIIAVNFDDTLNKVIELSEKTGYSRFPVIKDSIDNVVGIIHIKHVIKTAYEKRDKVCVKDVMDAPLFVPASVELDVLLEKVRSGKMQMAITIDEFGGTDGIVTIEDLVEELVGEVRDEHDRHGVSIRQLSKTSWLVSGLLRPDEVSEVIGLTLPDDEDFETMGGLLLDKLEDVPDAGDSISLIAVDHDGQRHELKLTVRSMEGNRVDRFILEVMNTKIEKDGSPIVKDTHR